MEIIAKVLPVILLFGLGIFLHRTGFLREQTIQDIKKLVINISLPAVLFLAFSKVTLQAGYLIIVLVIFTACVLALLIGRFLRRILSMPSPFFPMLMTGFEAGMMGYAIYAAVFGVENIYKFGIVDLGQVTFVFFVLVTLLERQSAAQPKPLSVVALNFFKTPVILAILMGVLANQSGVAGWMEAQPLAESILRTLEMLGALTTPLIAMVIGYEMRVKKGNLGRPLMTIAVRQALWVPFGLLFNLLLLQGVLHLDRSFQAAVMTMMVLPPPFVTPLFMQEAQAEDREYVVNTLSLSTLVTLVAFSIVSLLYQG
jgi:predicted permease